MPWFDNPPPTVRGFLDTDGAQALAACLEVQDQQQIRGSVAEVGVYCGKVFIGLALATRDNERAVGVDVFEFEGQSFRAEFDANLAAHVPAAIMPRVSIIGKPSNRLSYYEWQRALGHPARLVHIDGRHTREHVLLDLNRAVSFLDRLGVIVFDDFASEVFPDVTTGIVDGLRTLPHITPVAITPRRGDIRKASSKLVCAVRGKTQHYDEALRARFQDCHAVRREFLGEQVLILIPESSGAPS